MDSVRESPIEMDGTLFKKIGYQLVEEIADFLDRIKAGPVTKGETPQTLQSLLGNGPIPEKGVEADQLIAKATELLQDHSLLSGHPRFFGYITSSPAPIGALADLLASSINPNVGAHVLSPMATEIERQTISWLCSLVGLPDDYGGILVSGGNMANFTAFLAARTAKMPKEVKERGISTDSQKPVVYCPKSTHTWIEKAVVLFGMGLHSLRWIDTDFANRMDNSQLESTIQSDLQNGFHPIMVIGTAGDVSTGAVDDFESIAAICKKYSLWFHIDGAYGLPAVVVPEFRSVFAGMEHADSLALDPHKWLYSPLECGCTILKEPRHLQQTFSSHPIYYNFNSTGEPTVLNFYEYGLQNSRGFRALKVWLALQQVGRSGYVKMINEDIMLSKYMFLLASSHKELEAVTQNLSIATFRYVPKDSAEAGEAYLNLLNEHLVNSLQKGGRAFLSNAVVNQKYCLRACIVNFRTTKDDIEEVIKIVVEEGRAIHEKLQSRKE